MAASRQDIEGWLKRAEIERATHVIIVCDTFDHDDYPVYVTASQDIHERIKHFQNASMQRIMEVYNMALPISDQMREHRAYHP